MLNKFAAPIDYLAIGHITCDILPDGSITLGGSAAYSALTARALGLRPGILTAYGQKAPVEALDPIPIAGIDSEESTTFENTEFPEGRAQIVHHVAPALHPYMVPEVWRSPAIVHFAPVLQEIDLDLLRLFPGALACLTPQGWLRSVDADGSVRPADWLEAEYVLPQMDAVVLSIEDLGRDEKTVDRFAEASNILVVTEGADGCRLFERGYGSRFPAPEVEEVEATGAGDIFAATFFVYLLQTGDPAKAARIAIQLASSSVRKRYLAGVPGEAEILQAALEDRRSESASFT